MSQFVEGPTKTFVAGGALAQYRRVKLSSGKLAYAGAGASDYAVDIGNLERDTFADGEAVAVRLRNAQGTRKGVAAGPVSAGVAIYGAANGKIDDASSGTQIGISLEAALADGDIIEYLPFA